MPSSEKKLPIVVSNASILKTPSSLATRQRNTKNLANQISKPSKFVSATEMTKHQNNLEIVLRHSNATATRGFCGTGYACYYCTAGFPNPADLKKHTLESHKDFKQDFNGRVRRPKLNSYSVKLDITNLTCKECFRNYAQLHDFMDHLRVDHNKTVHTDVKNYLLPFRFDSDPLKCVLCDSEFATFKMAIEHMNVHYRNYICDECDAGFVNRDSLRAHTSNNHQKEECQCPQCHQVFNSVAKLKYHIKYVHLGQTKRNKCGYCGEKFSCVVMRNNHLVKVHGVSPTIAKCKACDKTFGSHRSLRAHHKIYHLQIKNFKCVICEKLFPGSNDLKNHMIKHTGIRDYKCYVCQKAFGRKYTLTEHMRIHNDDRRHKCEHCSMAFIQKCSLKSHLLSKHGVEIGK